MSIPEFEEIVEPNDQTEARLEHLDKLRELVGNVYPNKFERSAITGGEDTTSAIKNFETVVTVETEMALLKAGLKEGERPPAEFKDAINERLKALGTVRIAGRVTTPPRGNFVHLTDGIAKLQIYCKKGAFNVIPNDFQDALDFPDSWTVWQLIDHGDFIGVEGYLFVTNTGEVSVHVEKLQFLAKAMVPMPDKMHGIADPELQRRFRYADLIASTLQIEHEGLTTREVFERRAKLVSGLRRFLDDAGFIEVETPMLTPKATGAAAKPFKTHHNALDIPLYARVAPELYLKRLVVGGFEKVYELNRNFRNEGLSQRHNPEFTMLEFYIAYMDVNGMMDFAEAMLKKAVASANGGSLVVKVTATLEQRFRFGKEILEINFESFDRISMEDAMYRQMPEQLSSIVQDDLRSWLGSVQNYNEVLEFWDWYVNYLPVESEILHESGNTVLHKRSEVERQDLIDERIRKLKDGFLTVTFEERCFNQSVLSLFDNFVEPNLIQPTFIIDYPKSISPLSKADPLNPNLAERFELFINGMEVANGFSELNDPKEQYERFVDQMSERERGDEEAMVLDEDYVRALSYGMPPAAGIGIGIDRLVMLLTNKHSIRDVILFPHLRPEKREAEKGSGGEEETQSKEKET